MQRAHIMPSMADISLASMGHCQTAVEALKSIKSGDRIFLHGGVATPQRLVEGLVARANGLRDVEILHLHTEQPPIYADSKYKENFRVVNLFVGSNIRKSLDYDRIDYLPCFLSEIPSLFRSGAQPLDVALVQVSPPDNHGYVTLGTSVDVARAAVDSAKIVIAQINKQMPKVHGDSYLHISKISSWVEVDELLPEVPRRPLSEAERAVGRHVASIVEDGACLQLGIGAIPDAVASCLRSGRYFGVHSEMWSEGVLDLIESGAVDNSRKVVHRGKCVSSFLLGTKRLYDFVNDNPNVVQLGVEFVNDPRVILQNPKVVAINSAVEIDLTGQVCADSIGPNIISGVGGQMDFIRGAALSQGGKPVFAVLSRSSKGHSKIVSQLKPGAGVVSTRSHVHYVATEHGIVNLFGKTLSARAKALISIAHPEDQERLSYEWKRLHEHAR